MTKYEKLNNLFKERTSVLAKEYNYSREICGKFTVDFINKLVAYFDINIEPTFIGSFKSNCLVIYPTEDRDKNMEYTVTGVLKFKEGLWNFGFSLILSNHINCPVHFSTQVNMKYIGNRKINVNIEHLENNEFVIDVDDENSYCKFIQFVEQTLYNRISNMTINSQDKERIGF